VIGHSVALTDSKIAGREKRPAAGAGGVVSITEQKGQIRRGAVAASSLRRLAAVGALAKPGGSDYRICRV